MTVFPSGPLHLKISALAAEAARTIATARMHCRFLMGTPSVVLQVLAREKLLVEAEARQVRHALRVQDTVEVVALVLHDARVEPLGDAVDGIALLVEAGVAQLRVA